MPEGKGWGKRAAVAVHESEYVRLDITLQNSPSLEDSDDPLQEEEIDLFPKSHVTFYLGETLAIDRDDMSCSEDPCPENLVTQVDPGTYTVALGDRLMYSGAAIGIEKNRWYKDNIAAFGKHPRLRGCFLSIGQIDPPVDLSVVPVLLRPAPGKC